MVKRLHLYIIKSFIGPLFLAFVVSEFILIMNFLWLFVEDLVGKGLEWKIIIELFISAAAGMVNTALPLAILLASVMTFGNLGENYELSAMKSAGISLRRIMISLILFTLFISAGSFLWANHVVPYTNLRARTLIYDVGKLKPELNIIPGIFNDKIQNYSIKIGSKNKETGMMYDLLIHDHSENRGNPNVTRSDSGFMQLTENQKYMIITLYGGRVCEEMPEGDLNKRNYPERHETFEKRTIFLELKGFDLERTDEALFKHDYQTMSVSQLYYSIDSLRNVQEKRKQSFYADFIQNKQFRVANDKRYRNNIDSGKHENYENKLQLSKDTNINQLLEYHSPEQKTAILTSALESTNKIKTYLETNKTEILDRQKNIYKHESALYQKFTLAIACLIFLFIGAPLGAIIRKGGFGLPVIVSIAFFLFYYVVSLIGKKFAEEGTLSTMLGMWLSTVLTLPIGIFLTYKASNDSNLFDIKTIIDFLIKPFKLFIPKSLIGKS